MPTNFYSKLDDYCKLPERPISTTDEAKHEYNERKTEERHKIAIQYLHETDTALPQGVFKKDFLREFARKKFITTI